MEPRNLLPGNFFMNLLREDDADFSSTQFAALLVSSYLLVLLALWFIL
ncbi:hypothetical protein [Variovorax sp. V213]|jgi:hypothetical protein